MILLSDEILHYHDLMFWTAAVSITLFIALFSLTQLWKKATLEAEQKSAAYYWIVYLILMSTAHFISVINRNFNNFNTQVDLVTVIIVDIAIFAQIYYVERRIKVYKYPIFIILQISVTIAHIFINNRSNEIWSIILIILMVITYLFLPLIYLYIAIKSSGPIRAQTFKMAIALITLGLGSTMQSHNVASFYPELVLNFESATGIAWVIIPTSLTLIGVLLIFSEYLMKFINQNN